MTKAIDEDPILQALDDAEWLVAKELASMRKACEGTGSGRISPRTLGTLLTALQCSVGTRLKLNIDERLEELTDAQLRELVLADEEICARVGIPPKLPSH